MPDLNNTNPANMTDEELDAAISGNAPPVPKEDPKPDEPKPDEKKPEAKPEPKTEDPAEEEPEEPEEPAEDPEEPEEKPAPAPSKREQLRIHKLLEKYGNPEDPKPTAPKPAAGINYEEELNGDPELLKRLNDDREAARQSAYQQGLEQTKSIQFHTRLEIDAPRVEAKYPMLDKNSPEFKPELANAVNTMYLTTVGYDQSKGTVRDANLRYGDYVESVIELANEIAGDKTATATKVIKKQAAQTGLRPDGSQAKKMNLNKPPEQMTDEELDAAIAQGIPNR